MEFPDVMIVLTFFLVISFIVQPLFMGVVDKPDIEDRSLDILKLRKKVVYKQIKEAEMEFEMGNLSEEDFHRTRNLLKSEASKIIAQINQIKEKSKKQ